MDKNKLIEVLSIQSYSYEQELMLNYIEEQISKINCSYYFDNGNIYIIKGKAKKYPCVVAHMDTVHMIVEDLTVIELHGNLTGFNSFTMEQTGIGGDDKVGIFVALQCLEKFDNIKVAFFRDEEVGCDGSYLADVKFFNDCNIVLQCDRRGNNDFIHNASGVQLSSKEFQDSISPILKDYGYRLHEGMMTDVMALKSLGIKASMANISCGYYNPHQPCEYVNIADVNNCLNLVVSIINHIGSKQFDCKYNKQKRFSFGFNKNTKHQKFDFDFNKPYVKSQATATPSDFDYEFYRDDFSRSKSVFDECCESCGEIALLSYSVDYKMEICEKCSKWF